MWRRCCLRAVDVVSHAAAMSEALPSSPHIVMVGATGVVGARALRHLVDDGVAGQITVIGRRAPGLTHERVRPVLNDLKADVKAAIPDHVDVAVCCLGTTMKQAGSKNAFRAVDYDAVVKFAEAASARGAKRFVLVSSLGATSSSSSFYLKTKGEAEDAVVAMAFDDVEVLRPSVLDDEGARKQSRPGEKLGIAVMRAATAIIGKQHKYAPISVDTVGRAVASLATAKLVPGRNVLESDAIHRYVDKR